jgi:hypothetical protein
VSGGPLPNGGRARIDVRKFVEYSMHPGADNQRKAEAFRAIGYDVDTDEGRRAGAADVVAQLRSHLALQPARVGHPSPYGAKYEVDVPIRGPNGKEGKLVTVWLVESDDGMPRLITNWLEVHA